MASFQYYDKATGAIKKISLGGGNAIDKLDDLADVYTKEPQDGQIFSYDAEKRCWTNQDKVKSVEISKDDNNAILEKADGIYVEISSNKSVLDKLSEDDDTLLFDGNKIKTEISKEDGNSLVEKEDGLYVNAPSNVDTLNKLSTGDNNTLLFNGEKIKTGVSAADNNALVEKTDGLYVNIPQEIFIGDNEVTKKYSLFVDTDDINPKEDLSVQPDWNEDNTTLISYIKNKPNIPSIDGLATEKYVDQKMQISGISGNILEKKIDELYVPGTTIDLTVSEAAGNAVQIFSDGLYVSNDAVTAKVSKEKGNIAVMNVDGVYVPSTSISLSKQDNNALVFNDDGLYAEKTTSDEYTTKTFDDVVQNAINELNS